MSPVCFCFGMPDTSWTTRSVKRKWIRLETDPVIKSHRDFRQPVLGAKSPNGLDRQA